MLDINHYVERINYSGIVYFGDRINLSTITEYPVLLKTPTLSQF